jgi:hypothetical protein
MHGAVSTISPNLESQNNIAQSGQGYDVTMFSCSPRPRKRGSAPSRISPSGVTHRETAGPLRRDVEPFRVLSVTVTAGVD